MNPYVLRVALLCAFLGLAAFTATARQGGELITCGEDSGGTYYYGNNCQASGPPGYSTEEDACRAARGILRTLMVASTNASCDDDLCIDYTCVAKVRCLDAECSLLTSGPGIILLDGTWGCKACWGGGDFKVFCTPCG
jgi:hypothetical protein